jgi:hypothetical protein
MRKEMQRRRDGDQNGLTGSEAMVQREVQGCR